MQIYLVGGAVRDKLLGINATDCDYVVVGATPDQLLAKGYKQVGKDFPVFLHPDTGHEYALARTERRCGHGYHGFSFDTRREVTLEEDLARRDLTINAMAEHDNGHIIDPFGGQRDLANKVLRHVSPAFIEDPLRILRVARFAAKLAPMGFRVAPETSSLMQQMVYAGEVTHLVAERVWLETRRALKEKSPAAFLQTLRQSGALAILFPELDRLYGVPQTARHHPEIDTGTHVEMVLDMAAKLAPGNDLVAFCALVHDLGKGLTPTPELPRHIGHEQRGVAPCKALSLRLKVPKEYSHMGCLTCAEHLNGHRARELRPATLLKLLEKLNAFHRPERLNTFVLACEADARGRKGHEQTDYPQGRYLHTALDAAASITAQPFIDAGLVGKSIGQAVSKARIEAIARIKQQWQ